MTRMREKCERLNFKPTYQAILRVVAHEPGLSQLEIAGRVHLAPPTVSLALQKMEAEDLIRRSLMPVICARCLSTHRQGP